MEHPAALAERCSLGFLTRSRGFLLFHFMFLALFSLKYVFWVSFHLRQKGGSKHGETVQWFSVLGTNDLSPSPVSLLLTDGISLLSLAKSNKVEKDCHSETWVVQNNFYSKL